MSVYQEMYLVKVTQQGKDEYFAVTEETRDNMKDSSSAMQHIVDHGDGEYRKAQFNVVDLGVVKVERPK
jgi:hypothetical protein